MCKNAKTNLKNIIVRIFIFVIKNDDDDFISKFHMNKKRCFRLKCLSMNYAKLLFIRNVIQKKSYFKRSHLIIHRKK